VREVREVRVSVVDFSLFAWKIMRCKHEAHMTKDGRSMTEAATVPRSSNLNLRPKTQEILIPASPFRVGLIGLDVARGPHHERVTTRDFSVCLTLEVSLSVHAGRCRLCPLSHINPQCPSLHEPISTCLSRN
jgi:hypothetical protein